MRNVELHNVLNLELIRKYLKVASERDFNKAARHDDPLIVAVAIPHHNAKPPSPDTFLILNIYLQTPDKIFIYVVFYCKMVNGNFLKLIKHELRDVI